MTSENTGLGGLETKSGNKPLGGVRLAERDEWLDICNNWHKSRICLFSTHASVAQTEGRSLGLGYPD